VEDKIVLNVSKMINWLKQVQYKRKIFTKDIPTILSNYFNLIQFEQMYHTTLWTKKILFWTRKIYT